MPWLSLGQNTKVIIKFKKKFSPDFFKDASFPVSFHIKFGYMGCFDFSNDNLNDMFGYVTSNMKNYILSQIFYKEIK